MQFSCSRDRYDQRFLRQQPGQCDRCRRCVLLICYAQIGIPKVLGASVGSLLFVLSTEFLVLVGIAYVIAIPLISITMQSWLQEFAYRIGISWWIYGIAGALAVFIALLTVVFQSLKAALANPVKSLRTE